MHEHYYECIRNLIVHENLLGPYSVFYSLNPAVRINTKTRLLHVIWIWIFIIYLFSNSNTQRYSSYIKNYWRFQVNVIKYHTNSARYK